MADSTPVEHQILFKGPMIRAILDGRKTQTRRIISARFQSIEEREDGSRWPWREDLDRSMDYWYPCPYGRSGDQLWVRETCRAEELTAASALAGNFVNGDDEPLEGLDGVRYAADSHFEPIASTPKASDAWAVLHAYRGKEGATVPSIHMPRWASRITLEVQSVRVEPLQAISTADAIAEGLRGQASGLGWEVDGQHHSGTAIDCFSRLWDSTTRTNRWDSNPWVWVVTFARVENRRG